ncbi:hypothetical protein [Azospirillum sp. SYSU D00513]|uniref:hypothetical protein n=1 Tax=Azospirillum sp. SYSU D00513 TaxID=2812561 RepID=UPI001A96D243|nr:hypothetical protein [Azospirillum sp. SYSU D00513]
MASNLLQLFMSGGTAATFPWKTTDASAAGAGVAGPSSSPKPEAAFTPVEKPTTRARDAVEVSELGQALTGKAAELFGFLDPKVRGQLDMVVKEGLMSADEVALALHGEATDAQFSRYASEAAPSDEQKAMRARMKELNDLDSAFRGEVAPLARDFRASMVAAHASDDPRLIAERDTAGDRLREATAAARAKHDPDDGESNSDERSGLMAAHFEIYVDRFKALDADSDSHRGAGLVSRESLAAQKKLSKLLDGFGVDWAKFAYDTRRYARSVELPEVGRGAPLPSWDQIDKGPLGR